VRSKEEIIDALGKCENDDEVYALVSEYRDAMVVDAKAEFPDQTESDLVAMCNKLCPDEYQPYLLPYGAKAS
jgi:hypothetical protein